MNKMNKIVENLWLVLAIIAMGFAIFMLATKGWDKGATSLVFPLLCGVWYGFRRTMRKRMERNTMRNE